MTSGSSIDKRPDRKNPRRGKPGAAQFFRPLSPFAPCESDENEQLPDWARAPEVQRRTGGSAAYNFDWLSNPTPERSTSSAPRTHREPEQSPPSQSPPAEERPPATNEPVRSDSPDEADTNTSLAAENIHKSGSTDAMKKDNPLPPAIEHITASTPEETLKTARALSQDGKMQAAIGYYLYLVKSDQKLKQVVADLEAQRANPHIEQTPLMLQTLADAYTKTGKLAKALPLYRQALGR